MTNATFWNTVKRGIRRKSWKTKPDVAAERLHLRRPQRLQVAAQHFQLAFARQVLAQQQAQQRRLAGAARTGEEDELAFVDGEGQVAQRVDAAVVELGR
jgi:hypothetical protein